MAGNESWSMARIASRRPLPRECKMHGPVGKSWSQLADEAGLDKMHVSRHYDGSCAHCGFAVCDCVRRSMLQRQEAPKAVQAVERAKKAVTEAEQQQHWRWALDMLREGKTLRGSWRSGEVLRLFRVNVGRLESRSTSSIIGWGGYSTLDEWVSKTEFVGDDGWSVGRFEVVDP